MPTPIAAYARQYVRENERAVVEIVIGTRKVKAIWRRAARYMQASVDGQPEGNMTQWAQKGMLWYRVAEVVCAYHDEGITEDTFNGLIMWKYIGPGVADRIRKCFDTRYANVDDIFREPLDPFPDNDIVAPGSPEPGPAAQQAAEDALAFM